MPYTIISITTPIVGAHFRPPAKQVLTVLPIGTPLILIPEPDNPYDTNAIRVLVSLHDTYPLSRIAQLQKALEGTGFDASELIRNEPEVGSLFLGYIPKSGAKTCQGGPGNIEVLHAISLLSPGESYSATFTIATLEGSPAVEIQIPSLPKAA